MTSHLNGARHLFHLAIVDDVRLHGPHHGVCVVEGWIEGELAPDLARGRELDSDLHEEAVACRGRQLEGLLALDAVAVGEDEQIGKAVFAVEGGDAALGHEPQQERMHLRARPVDLVEEEHGEVAAVTQHRPGVDARAAVLAEIGVIDEVRGHQVDRAFDPLERAAKGARRRAQQRRLADADIAFQENVAAGENGNGEQPDDTRLPDDGAVECLFESERPAPPMGKIDRLDRVRARRFADRHVCPSRSAGKSVWDTGSVHAPRNTLPKTKGVQPKLHPSLESDQEALTSEG